MPPSEPDSLILAFLGEFLADRLQGTPRTLADYLARFPAQQAAVAAAWLEATQSGRAGELAADEKAGQAPGTAEASGAAPAAGRASASRPAGGDPDAPPEVVGPYRLLRELGRGAQGSVWLARDERLGRAVALKLVPASPLFRDQAPRFRREAQAASRLDHPGLCAVYDIGTDGSVAWIAMRFVEGETLAARLARTAPPADAAGVDAAVLLVERVARALHVAHEAGIVHRDVKPANIMLAADDTPVVLDFGIARQAEADGPLLTLTGEAPGTPAYMAPEALAGEAQRLDARMDVWSLGITLHELLAGERPFEAPTRAALVRAILDAEAPDLRAHNHAVSRDLAVVLQTALAKEPDRRYASALAFAEDLARVRAREPVSARPVGRAERLLRWARRHRALAASLALLLLVLAGGLAVTSGLLASTRETLAQKQQLLDDVTQLSDHKLAQDLLAEERTLWPAAPERAADMRRWLGEARAVLGRRARHEASLANTQARSAQASVADAWLREQLTQLLAVLATLGDAATGVASRLQFAEDIERLTLHEPRAAWAEAAAAVTADPRFAGLVLRPQRGLLPLGADPDSGLQEFVLLQSGEPPRRDAASGRLQLTAECGIVLVLLPGGVAQVGCEAPGPERAPGTPNTDPQASQYDGPVQRVALDPFFIGKFELTQAQWQRHAGSNPSTYAEASKFTRDSDPPRHPVESVSWHDASRVLSELGLLLPTDVQWEYAARAGAGSAWWTGDDVRSLDGAANLADAFARANGAHESWPCVDWLDDGYTAHAPVGSFRANAFGLHDTAGNVMEWCRDTWEDWALVTPRPGDGYCHDRESAPVIRGGAYNSAPVKARSGARDGFPPEVAVYNLGLRAARALDR